LGVSEHPTFVAFDRMPELTQDIRLILDALIWIAEFEISEFDPREGRDALVAVLDVNNHNEEILAAYDRLVVSFGKDAG
jgi:hypothetical protein